jgi:hypothetical protein
MLLVLSGAMLFEARPEPGNAYRPYVRSARADGLANIAQRKFLANRAIAPASFTAVIGFRQKRKRC